MLPILVGQNKHDLPEIVWRNPNRAQTHRRRHSFEPLDGRALYSVQEYVEAGDCGFWLTISDLEVVAGGRAA